MTNNARSLLLRYGCAALSIFLATWLRLLLDPALGVQLPVATLFFAILLTAWYGGFRPALAAVVLGALAAVCFLIPPRGSFAVEGRDQQVGILVFLSTGLGIALLGGAMHSARRKAERDIATRLNVEQELRDANEQLETRDRECTAELTRINESLRYAEERVRFLIEGVQEYAIFMLDPSGNVVTWNKGAERNKGYRTEEILGCHFSCFYPQEDIAAGKPERELKQALAEGRCEDVGWRIRKDGSRFWARVVITPLHDDEGRLRGFAKVTRDITEARRAEDRFRQAVESAPNGMVMINPEGKIVLVNAQTEKLFGYTRDELLGQPVELLIPERFRATHPDYRTNFFANPQVRSMGVGRDLYGQRKDGSEFPVEIGLNPIKTEEGLLVLSAIVDITERKRAEDRFRQAVESAPNGMVMINPAGKIVLVNAQTEKLFGYRREELLGQLVELLVPERFRGQHPSYREGFFARPQVRSMGVGRDLFGRRKDGSEFPVEIGLNPIHTEEGLLVLSAIVDITERKRAERTLFETSSRLQSLMNALPVGVSFSDDATCARITGNPAVLAQFGVNDDDNLSASAPDQTAKGRQVAFFHEGRPVNDFELPLQRAVAENRLIEPMELEIHLPDGRRWFAEATGVPIRDDKGTVIAGVAVTLDITDRKNADKAIRQLNSELEQWLEQLEQTNRELKAKTQENETFVYSVSHDLRSPLVNLQGFSKELGRAMQDLRSHLIEANLQHGAHDRELKILDGSMAKSIHFIQTAVARLSSIIDALLRLSRAGRVIYQRKAVEVKDLVRRIVDSLEVTAKERGATIEINDLPPALGDPAVIEQVFANLIGNALNYLDARRPGRIEVGCVKTTSAPATPRSGEESQSELTRPRIGGGSKFSFLPLSASGRGSGGGVLSNTSHAGLHTYFIRDNGLGISEAGKAKVFQPFQRLHPQSAPGEGMGLAIVQRVIERHGGKIWFESVAGQGSTFFVALPAFLDCETPSATLQSTPSEKGSPST